MRACFCASAAVAGGDRGEALRQLAIAAPAPAVAPAFEQRARRADDPAIEQPQRHAEQDQRQTTATSSTPTLVSSRQPRHCDGDGARPFGEPHRGQHQRQRRRANQISVRRKVIAVPRAPSRATPCAASWSTACWAARCASARASQSAVAREVCGRQRLHQLDGLARGRRPSARPRRARAWLRPNRPPRRRRPGAATPDALACRAAAGRRNCRPDRRPWPALAMAGKSAARLAREATPLCGHGLQRRDQLAELVLVVLRERRRAGRDRWRRAGRPQRRADAGGNADHRRARAAASAFCSSAFMRLDAALVFSTDSASAFA